MQAEHLLRDDRAAEQDADVETEDGDDGAHRAAPGEPEEHRAPGEALGAGGPDVVLAQRLDELGARHTGVVGGEDQRQHEPGEQQSVEPGGRVLGERDVLGAAQDVPLVGQVVHGDHADDVDLHRGADQRRRGSDLVHRLALLDRCQHAGAHAEDHEDERAADGEGERGREAVQDGAEDRLAVVERIAQARRGAVAERGVVASDEHALEPVPVLHGERVGDAEVALDQRQCLRRAHLAAGHTSGVAGRDIEEDEGDGTDDQQDDQCADCPADEEAEHGDGFPWQAPTRGRGAGGAPQGRPASGVSAQAFTNSL